MASSADRHHSVLLEAGLGQAVLARGQAHRHHRARGAQCVRFLAVPRRAAARCEHGPLLLVRGVRHFAAVSRAGRRGTADHLPHARSQRGVELALHVVAARRCAVWDRADSLPFLPARDGRSSAGAVWSSLIVDQPSKVEALPVDLICEQTDFLPNVVKMSTEGGMCALRAGRGG